MMSPAVAVVVGSAPQEPPARGTARGGSWRFGAHLSDKDNDDDDYDDDDTDDGDTDEMHSMIPL